MKPDRSGLAASDVEPVLFGVQRVAGRPGRHADRRVVLLAPVEPVGEPVVDDHVVELGRRLVHVTGPGRSTVQRHLRAAVVRHDHDLRVGRVDPEVVDVAVGHRNLLERLAAVHRAMEADVQSVDRVLVHRVSDDMGVVEGSLPQLVLAVHPLPRLSCVVGAVDAAIGLRLDDRPDTVRVRR